MTLDDLKATRKRIIGTKQTTKALLKQKVKVVFVARDADEYVTRDIVKVCREKNVELVQVESMAVLGKACGIEVGAATAAILEE